MREHSGGNHYENERDNDPEKQHLKCADAPLAVGSSLSTVNGLFDLGIGKHGSISYPLLGNLTPAFHGGGES